MATKKDWIHQCHILPSQAVTSHVICVSINLLKNLVAKNRNAFFNAKPWLNCNFDACICQMRMFYSRKTVLNHKLCTQKQFIKKKCGYGSRLIAKCKKVVPPVQPLLTIQVIQIIKKKSLTYILQLANFPQLVASSQSQNLIPSISQLYVNTV